MLRCESYCNKQLFVYFAMYELRNAHYAQTGWQHAMHSEVQLKGTFWNPRSGVPDNQGP